MAVAALKSLDALPQAPASDVKKLGWRGVMKAVARNGRLVVTHHNQPQAVILPAEEYTRLLDLLRDAAARDELALDALRRKFDERLARLDAAGAGDRLAALFDQPFTFEGTRFSGDGF